MSRDELELEQLTATEKIFRNDNTSNENKSE